MDLAEELLPHYRQVGEEWHHLYHIHRRLANNACPLLLEGMNLEILQKLLFLAVKNVTVILEMGKKLITLCDYEKREYSNER